MSAQSILHKSICSIATAALNDFIENSNKHLRKKRFELGDGYNRFDQADSAMLYDMIELGNCCLTQYINTIIEQGPDEEFELSINEATSDAFNTAQGVTTSSTDALYALWLSRGNSGTLSQFLDILTTDEQVEWEEINW